jgi:hypothetical protein
MAGIGLAYGLLWAQKRWSMLIAYFIPAAFIALMAFQIGSAVSYYPYYYTYKNPFVSRGGIHGYGEGLNKAADYLAQKPNAKELRVIAYAARGCFSYFYPGKADHMKIGLQDGSPYVEEIQDADYLVVYTIIQKGKPDGAELMRVLQDVTPEHIVYIDNLEYARIYKIVELPKDILNSLIQK